MFPAEKQPGPLPVPETDQDTADEVLHSIGETCAEFGVTARALRFYEAKELIAPLRVGQKRLYGRRCRARLTLILRGRRFGFSLEQIRQLLGLYDIDDGRATQLARVCEMAEERLEAMEAQRSELDTAIAELRGQLAAVRSTLKDGRAAAAE